MTAPDVLFTLAEGRYEVLDAIGAGGMATVHRCRDLRLGVERAVKLVQVAQRSPATIQRCLDEARAMATVDHPAILPAVDAGVQGGRFYLVMPLAQESLAARLRRDGPLTPHAAVARMIPVLRALQAAHDRGIIHRDVKPENILLDTRGSPMLADFGVARIADRSDRLTRTGAGLGTWATMAPEQRVDAHRVGPPADIYAAAATLYQITTGETPLDLFAARPTSPRWDSVPPPLRPLLQRATAVHEAVRPPTAAAFADELESLLPTLTDATVPTPAPRYPPSDGQNRTGSAPPADRQTLAAIVVAVATLPLCLGLVFLLAPGPVRLVAENTALPAGPASPEPPPLDAPSGLDDSDAVSPPPRREPSPPGVGAPVDDSAAGRPAAPARTTDTAPATAEEPIDASASLAIHGTWRGSLDGAAVRLHLAGPADQLRATTRNNTGSQSRVGRGHFDPPARVELRFDPNAPAAETWRLTFTGGRLEGTVSSRATGEIVPIALRRASDP